MATASAQTDPKCSICLEAYKQRRKLPGCSHSFCETCIVTFVEKLKAEDKLGLEFQCPVCRLPSESPKDDDKLKEWVRKMDKDNELEKQVDGQSDETRGEICNPCKLLNKRNALKYYCLNCEEYLCQGCSDILHVIKQNRNHSLIEAKNDKPEQFHKPALELMSQLLTCLEHPTNHIEFYCEGHRQAACYKCATANHRMCSNVREVKEIPQFTLKSSLTKVNSSVTIQVEYIQQILNAYNQNEDQNKINKETIHTEIQTIKENVVKLFDALEDNLKQSSSALIKNINLKNLEEIEDLKPMLQELNVMDYLIKTYLASATPDQMFVGIEGLKRMCQDIEKRVIEKGRTAKTIEVFLKVNDMLNSILKLGQNKTAQLATIEEKEATTKIAKYKQHRAVKFVKSRDIIASGSASSPTYNDLLHLPNNHLLLVDSFYGYCCLVNERYIEIASRVNVSTIYPNVHEHFKMLQYATFLENDKLAISMCQDKKVRLASSADLSFIATIDCKYVPMCMVGLDNNTVAISWRDPVAFGIIEIQDSAYSDKVYFTTDNTGRQLKSFDYMAVDKDLRHVIQSCKVDKAVYCFNLSGDPVFTYKPAELNDPRGVAVDNDSNVYICDMRGAGIHVVSSSGVAMKVLRDGCPAKPLAIGFSSKGNSFAVSEYEKNWKRIHFFALIIDD